MEPPKSWKPLERRMQVRKSLARSLAAIRARRASDDQLAARVRKFLEELLEAFPWRVRVQDWTDATYLLGGDASHWSGHDALDLRLTPAAGRDLIALDIMRFLERFLEGEIGIEGNLYLFPELRNYAKLPLKPWEILKNRLRNRILQAPSQASRSVKSHYDIPEEALFYLDRVYRSYSCGMFECPSDLSIDDLVRVGVGERDAYDSLERAQWRKFAHAADYLAPSPDETVLDVGCGYPGFLMVLMDRHPCRQVVGWTHSANQAREGQEMLSGYDPERYELHEGDYREDQRVYDHIHSTGMISHVGPPGRDSGLLNYAREVRGRIKIGGRYVHHALMTSFTGQPLFDTIGPAFNRRYVWPGFYWYTLGEHVETLERNGFQIVQVINLTPHYAKTTRAWHERMIADEETFVRHAGESTYRAWQVFLAGITGSFLNRQTHCYRILCEAVDIERPDTSVSDPARSASARMKLF